MLLAAYLPLQFCLGGTQLGPKENDLKHPSSYLELHRARLSKLLIDSIWTLDSLSAKNECTMINYITYDHRKDIQIVTFS